MNFQSLAKIESADTYLDVAFHEGSVRADASRREIRNPDKFFRSKRIEQSRIFTIGKVLSGNLANLISCFPNLDGLAPFYQELIKCTIDYPMLKKSLGAINWARGKVTELSAEYKSKVYSARYMSDVVPTRRQFIGRVSSILKQISQNLRFLEESRKIMKRFPALKTTLKTVVIAGAPNVGKSTLLKVLTGSNAKIAPYPFTTQNLNLGYHDDVQYIDTPGLLDRPLSERNAIEKHAILALKHLATGIIFVIDPTESCGYTISEQKKILEDMKKQFSVKIILVSNKADSGITYPKALAISAEKNIGIDELKKEIISLLEKAK